RERQRREKACLFAGRNDDGAEGLRRRRRRHARREAASRDADARGETRFLERAGESPSERSFSLFGSGLELRSFEAGHVERDEAFARRLHTGREETRRVEKGFLRG